MVNITIPADKFPGLAYDGTKTFAGVLQSNFTAKDIMGRNIGISKNWNDQYAAQIARDYTKRILPTISLLFGNQKPMHEYREEDFNAILNELTRVHHYEDSSIQRYHRHLWCVYKSGVQQNEYPDNIMWDIPEEEENEENQEQTRQKTLTRIRKSFSIHEDILMLKWFYSLDPATATGEEIGLGMMYFLGVRDNEACGASFGDFKIMHNHPDMAIFTIGNTTSIGSHSLKPGGKSSNAPRQLPLHTYLYNFIMKRKEHVQNQIAHGHISLPQGIESIDMLPVVCRKTNYTHRAETHDLSAFGRILFPQIGITESELKWLLDILMSEDFRDTFIDEKDPTPYLLRRNVVTRQYHLGFSWEDIQYWIAHDIESVHVMRNFYSDEETLYELGKAYEQHPIFAILSAITAPAKTSAGNPPLHAHTIHLQANETKLIHVDAREPNTPVFITAHSDSPFPLVMTATEKIDLPNSLVSVLGSLSKAYWRVYHEVQANSA